MFSTNLLDKNGFAIFSLAVAVDSKGCMWSVTAAVWAVTVLRRAVVAVWVVKDIIRNVNVVCRSS